MWQAQSRGLYLGRLAVARHHRGYDQPTFVDMEKPVPVAPFP